MSLAIADDARLEVAATGPAWVGRAAVKLEHAFVTWGCPTTMGVSYVVSSPAATHCGTDAVGSRRRTSPGPSAADRPCLDVTGRRCLDVGASTGGFTQVLLHHGAAEVVALDVGHGQLVPAIADDPRVSERSGTSIRDIDGPDDLGGPFEVVVADLSFISLTLVVGEMARLLDPGGDLVLLVKPQFEVGRAGLGKRGVVTDPRERGRALRAVADSVVGAGLHVRGLEESPITGGAGRDRGNTEYLLWASSDPSGKMGSDAVTERVTGLTTASERPRSAP